MKCKDCGTKWSCEDSSAPGGNNAPGVFLVAGSAFAAGGIVCYRLNFWLPVQLIAAIGAALCFLYLPVCIFDCWGHRRCPKCNRAHVVLPWSF